MCLPSLSLLAPAPQGAHAFLSCGSIDHCRPHGSQFTGWLLQKSRHNPSELSTLTIFFPRLSSAQLQTVSKIQIALRPFSQVDHKTQAPLIIYEIVKLFHHITVDSSDPVFRPTFRRPHSSSGRRCRQATPSCFTAMWSRSPPEEGPLSDGGRT